MSMDLKYKQINQFSKVEALDFLNSFDSFLFDMDGVIFLSNDIIPGARNAINGLREMGKNINFVTNNTMYNSIDFVNKFEKNGIQCNESQFIFTTKVIAAYLKRINFKKQLFILGSKKSKEYFESLGYTVYLKENHEVLTDMKDLKRLLPELQNKNVGAVIVDLDININYANICRAQLLLTNPDILFLYGTADDKIPIAKNVSLLGFHKFKEMLINYTGRIPQYFAKPSDEMATYIQTEVKQCCPERTIFIGDSLHNDMLTASKCGFKKLLVFSGTTTKKDVDNCQSKECCPDYVANSLKDISDLLLLIHNTKS